MLPNVGVVGRAQTGKDTIAGYLVRSRGYARVGLADPVRDLALRLDPIVTGGRFRRRRRLSHVVTALGWERAKTEVPEVRRTLQRLGTDVIRHGINPDAWVDLAVATIIQHNAEGRPVVVPDVRFPNEAAELPAQVNAHVWRVTRRAAPAVLAHESESYADALPADIEITNDGDLADLFRRVDHAVAGHTEGVMR